MKNLLLTLTMIIALIAIVFLTACSGGTSSTTTTTSTAASPLRLTQTSTTAPTTSTTAAAKPFTVNLGGTFAVTGAYAEDVAACLKGYQDYAKWVNENHILAPWYKDMTIPANWTININVGG